MDLPGEIPNFFKKTAAGMSEPPVVPLNLNIIPKPVPNRTAATNTKKKKSFCAKSNITVAS